MNNVVTTQGQQRIDRLPLNIEAIKKAFIQLHQLPAANEQMIRDAAGSEHIIRVKDWLQDLERELGVKAKVVASASECGLTVNTPATVVDDEVVLFANHIDHQKMALDVFEYAAVGLLGVQRLSIKDSLCTRIFADLNKDTQEFLAQNHNLHPERSDDQILMIKMYLADLAALNIRLTWLERREAWQRQCVRLLYSKMAFSSLDLHYLLLKARRRLRKN